MFLLTATAASSCSLRVTPEVNSSRLLPWHLCCRRRCRNPHIQPWRRQQSCCKASSEGDNENCENDPPKVQDNGNVENAASHESEVEPILDKDTQEPLKVITGSPLPGVKPLGETVMIPRNILEVLRDQIFGFDTYFVTGQQPYEGGVIFKGNLRGDPSISYSKLNKRLQDKFGDQYKLFLLLSPEDNKPVAIVVPKESVQPESSSVPEWLAASLFGLATVFTILLRNSPTLQLNFLSSLGNLKLLLDGLPGALVTALILVAHEAGHYYAARNAGVELGVPYFIPSWQIGSFGGITRITSIPQKRQDLLEVAAAGPLAGISLSLFILLLGLLLPPGEGQGILINATAFHDSLIVGILAKAIFGESLKEGASLSVNPMVLWAWSGLLINAINSIPYGELDGGRISLALWGRKVWSRINGLSVALLGFSAFFSDVALYWVVLAIFLQRGPIAPQAEEMSPPDKGHVAAGVAVLFFAVLVCFPFPFPFT